jgi:hypothetical protein
MLQHVAAETALQKQGQVVESDGNGNEAEIAGIAVAVSA